MSDELDRAYGAQRRRLTAIVTAAVARAWAGSFREREQAIEQMVALVEAGQLQMAALVDAYMAAKTGQRIKGMGAPQIRDLAEAYEAYAEPFGAMAIQLEAGAALTAAIASGRARAVKLAATDLQLAQTYVARDWIADEPNIVGYRRVINSAKPCGLCVAASTQRYHRSDLMPIHEHCSCTVSPIVGEGEAPRIIEPERWRVVKKEAAGDLSAAGLSRLRYERLLPDETRVVPDPVMGWRLVEPQWAAAH